MIVVLEELLGQVVVDVVVTNRVATNDQAARRPASARLSLPPSTYILQRLTRSPSLHYPITSQEAQR
jgi:hypothetical protein